MQWAFGMSLFGNKFEANLEERVKIGEKEFAVGVADAKFSKKHGRIRGQVYIYLMQAERSFLGLGPRKRTRVFIGCGFNGEPYFPIIDEDIRTSKDFISKLKCTLHEPDYLSYLEDFGLTKQRLKHVYDAFRKIHAYYDSYFQKNKSLDEEE